MKKLNLKIQTQLQVGFAAILAFVLVLGAMAWVQTDLIAAQTQELYNHPLRVRRAIGELTADILNIRIGMKDLLFVSQSEAQSSEIIGSMETYQVDAFDMIDILYAQYLGPQSDVDLVKQEFILWNAVRAETISLLRAGKIAEAQARSRSDGAGVDQAEAVISALGKIDAFALNKGDELFANSQSLNAQLNQQLWILLATVLLLSLVIYTLLLRNIRQPLGDLTRATQAFQSGNLGARSAYALKNEFGVLADSYNQLAETIQVELESKAKTVSLSALMLGFNEAEVFFQATLSALAEQTSSQMAAVYLLSRDQKSFEHFASIGLDEGGRAAFGADVFDGEFGAALASQKIQHIAGIPADTRFAFSTVSGSFTPREIITLPITSNSHTVAVISLATIEGYTKQKLRFINDIQQILNARVVGVLAYRQIQTLAENLDQQNRELDAQKNELNAQAVELNQQNVELEAQKIQLSEASRQKTSFISNMSHELRTPLNSVIALSGVLNRRLAGQIPEEEYSYLGVIERNGKQLLALINDILDLSRIEAGREEIEVSLFDINNLVAEVVSIISPLARQKNIELLQHSGPGFSPMLNDIVKCRRILQNLVSNAVKFTDSGRVEISTQQKGGKFQIAVRDTGIGISQEHLPHIFDEFRQADGSTSRRFGGTGLGLAIAKKYAQLLGGSISVKSVPGEGSVFTLSLPLRLEPDSNAWKVNTDSFQESAVRAISAGSDSDQIQKTILVVEDSEPAIIQLKDIFEAPGYRILVARNGAEALEIIRHTLPDAIILDLMMPGVGGFEVLKTVRNAERTAHLPVLILTAQAITKEELNFLNRNQVFQLIQKGDINRSELLTAVAGMLCPQTAKPQPVLQSIQGKALVLAVEDNPDNMLTVKALMADDFTVIEATDGKAAIEQARMHKPHLILMDIALPEMDGIQAFNAIRNETGLQNIPVIALTASAMTSDREAILAYGFDGYIPKPIDHQEFIRTIRQVLYGKN
jgi:signal transduction histidine kinase/CheY-like chemotaxis protein/HAMP domain-containing protein